MPASALMLLATCLYSYGLYSMLSEDMPQLLPFSHNAHMQYIQNRCAGWRGMSLLLLSATTKCIGNMRQHKAYHKAISLLARVQCSMLRPMPMHSKMHKLHLASRCSNSPTR